MRGSLLTEGTTNRPGKIAGWRSRLAGLWSASMLASVAVGVLAGLVAAQVRLHLGLPGHKALFWMAPVLVARLLGRHPLGATVGASAAACTALGLGENLAGGLLYLPLVALAGTVLDVAAGLAERRHLSARWLVPLLGASGLAANVLCAAKRLLTPLKNTHFVFGVEGAWATVLSYALFGLLAGVGGAALAVLARGARQRREL